MIICFSRSVSCIILTRIIWATTVNSVLQCYNRTRDYSTAEALLPCNSGQDSQHSSTSIGLL